MSDYPLTKLGDVVTEVSRKTIVVDNREYDLVGAHWYAKGLYVKDKKNGRNIKAKYLYEIKEGDFVYNRLFGWKGSFAVATSELDGCFVSGEFPSFKANNARLLAKYLWYYFSMEPVWELISAVSRGSTPTSRKRFRQEEFLDWEIPLPPISIQKKVVECLDLFSDILARTETSLNIITNMKRSLMQQLFARGIGHSMFRTTKIGKIPEQWDLEPLISLCTSSGEYGANTSAINRIEGFPRYVRITDINEMGYLLDNTWKSIHPDDASGYILQQDDFLFARTGATVGKTYLYREEDALCAFAGYLIRFKPDSSKLLPKYLFHYTHSDTYFRWVQNMARTTAQPNINAKEYGNLLIPLPTIDEQNKIVSILDSVDRTIQNEMETRRKIVSLKEGVMQVLLTGNACVK